MLLSLLLIPLILWVGRVTEYVNYISFLAYKFHDALAGFFFLFFLFFLLSLSYVCGAITGPMPLPGREP